MNNYISSVVCKYGDEARVKRDAATVFEIIERQGSTLLLDLIAESCAETANKFSMTDDERYNLRTSLIRDLTDALCERV